MQWNERDIEVVRKVADEMWESDGDAVLPGWDPRYFDGREAAVRRAARAVLATMNPDDAFPVPVRALGALLRYVVDILEP